MSDSFLQVQTLDDGSIVRIKLDRPKARNAENRGMLVELDQARSAAEDNDGVRVVILGGTGQDFSSGHDMDSKESLEGRNPGPNQHPTATVNGGTRDRIRCVRTIFERSLSLKCTARSSRLVLCWPGGVTSSSRPTTIAERPTITAALVKESVNQSVDTMRFQYALQACHVAPVEPLALDGCQSDDYAAGCREHGVPDWRTSPPTVPAPKSEACRRHGELMASGCSIRAEGPPIARSECAL